jgi:glycosyltransferase involved in cell wall biosynthesis
MIIKVLFILPTLHAGGAENYALRFIRFCGNEQYDWYVLSPNLHKGDLHDDFEKAGCKIIYQSIGYFDLHKSYKLYKLYKEHEFDVVTNFNGNFSGLSLLVASIACVPKKIAWHRRSTDAFGNNFFKKAYNRFANQLVRWNATHILSNSQFAFDNFYGKYQKNDKRFMVIPNGVDASLFDISATKEEARKILDLPVDSFIIGHVGRYDPAKNHETIFKVIASLKEKGVQFKFLFCGKGTDSAIFKSRLSYYDIESSVICLGLSKNVPLVYRTLDLFYFPSVTEGQPNALIEAMLSGVPFIASNILPIKEIIPEKFQDYLVEADDVQNTIKKMFKIQTVSHNKITSDTKNWASTHFDPFVNFNKHKLLLHGK